MLTLLFWSHLIGEDLITPKDLKKLKKDRTRFEKSCQKLHRQVDDLKDELSQVKEEKRRELDDLSNQQNQRDKEHARQLGEADNLQKNLTDLINELQRSKDNVKFTQAKNSELSDQITEQNSTIKELSAKLCEQSIKIVVLKQTLSDTDTILAKTNEQLEWYEKEAEKYQVEVDRVKDLNFMLNEENGKKKHELGQCLVRVVEYKNQCNELEKRHQLDLDNISKLETQVLQLKAVLYDNDNSTKDIEQTLHTYENALRDKDDDCRAQTDVIKERDVTIDTLKRDVHHLNDQISLLNKQVEEKEETIEALRHTINDRDQELDRERSTVTEFSSKYHSSIEKHEETTRQLNDYYTQNNYLQQSVLALDAIRNDNEIELYRLNEQLSNEEERKTVLELENEKIKEEMGKWKKGHAYLQELSERRQALLVDNQQKIQNLQHTLGNETKRVTELEIKIRSTSDTLSNCMEQIKDLQQANSTLRGSCDDQTKKIEELELTIAERDETIENMQEQCKAFTDGHCQLINAHDMLTVQCTNNIKMIHKLEKQLKKKQDELDLDKEAYKFCMRFKQRIHASRLNRENEVTISFRERLPGEDFIDCLQKENLELRDDLATSTLEAANLQISVRERNEQINQLKTQLYGCQDRVFELQKRQARNSLCNGD